MPYKDQINRYIVNHGVKDQLLAMFDQTLRSDYFDKADPWYVKSLFDLTYLIRNLVSDAVNEHMTLLSPLEAKKVVDQEILKLYWHFFAAQKGTYDLIKTRYKGIERLKTLSYIINKANFCIKNPNNINVNLKLAGFEEWGESFLNFNSNVELLALLQEELDHLLTFKVVLNDAIKDTKAFRVQNKSSSEKDVQVDTFANKLSKGLMVTRLLDELEAKLDGLDQAIKEAPSIKLNQSEHVANDFIERSEDADYTYDSDGEINYEENNAYIVDIDISEVNPKLKNILNLSINNYDGDATEFEHKLLSLLESSFGFRLIDLHVRNFIELEPLLLHAIETSDLTMINMYLAYAYPKKIPDNKVQNLHPKLVSAAFWPTAIEVDPIRVKNFDYVVSFFNKAIKFKKSKKTSDYNLSSLLKRKEMSDFYNFYAQKMCSFTPELTGLPEHRYKSIELERVDQRFKDMTSNLVFKFASLVKLLKCDQLSKDEVEDLGIQLEKTINYLSRPGQVDPYDFIAKWSLKRYQKLNNQANNVVKDPKELTMFQAFYASDFESEDSNFMNFLSTDESSIETAKEARQKFKLIGGFAGLDNKAQMMEVINILGMQNKQLVYSDLNNLLDQIFIDKKSIEASRAFNAKNVKVDLENCYRASKNLSEDSKKFLTRYALLAYKSLNNAKYTGQQDTLLNEFIKLNENIFNKSIYKFSNKLISKISGFITGNNINYESWQAWLQDSKITEVNSGYIDVFTLYNIMLKQSESPALAVSNTLKWLDRSYNDRSTLAELTYIDENIKNSTKGYGEILKEASQVAHSNFTGPKAARIFPLLRSLTSESKVSNTKQSKELEKDIIDLLNRIDQEVLLPSDLNLNKLLESDSGDVVLDQDFVSSAKKTIDDLRKNIISDEVVILSESEQLLQKAGYESDFSDEVVKDLPSYHVFFNALLPHLKQQQVLDLLFTDEKKPFSPKALKDVLATKEKSLMNSIENQQKQVNDVKEKSKISSNFANELRLVFLAFDAINKEKALEDINLSESISISGVNPDVDRQMMMQLMPNIKAVDMTDESGLSSIISILKLVEKTKHIGLDEKDVILAQLEKNDNGLKQKLFEDFSQLRKFRKGINKYTADISSPNIQDELFVFVDAVKTLRVHHIEDQQAFVSAAKNAYFKVPLSYILDKMSENGIIGLVKQLGKHSRESAEIRGCLSNDKLLSLSKNLYENTDGFIDVDFDNEEDLSVSEKALFFLSQQYPEIYDAFIKEYLYKTIDHLISPLSYLYLSHLIEKADENLEQAEKAHNPTRLSTQKALASATQELTKLNTVKYFYANGFSEIFINSLSYLLPGNDNRKQFDQLISQFAPTWSYELSLNKHKEIADMALSTQLLAHHGAAKLFNNNLNYHLPKEVADITVLITLTLMIISIVLSWSSVATGILAATFAASVFMKVCVMHNREMALKPYSIYDRLGLMESLEQVKSIWAKYDNAESKIIIQMLECFELVKDSESLYEYDRQFGGRLKYIDLVKLAEAEQALNINVESGLSVKDRVVNAFTMQKSILSKKLFIKQVDMQSNVALSNGQLNSARKLLEHAESIQMSDFKNAKSVKQFLVSYLEKEHPEFPKERLISLYNFIFDVKAENNPLRTKDPLDGFTDNDIAKFLSNMYAIKKVKAQLEDFATHDEFFPTYHELRSISDIKSEDLKLMEAKGIQSFADIEKLVDDKDFTGSSLSSGEYNYAVRNIISDYMKSSGENIRMAGKIKPMSMFGCIKIDDQQSEEDMLQSSFNLGAEGAPLST